MILFLAKEIGGNHGNPTANLDFVISLLLTKRKVGIIYFSMMNIPVSINGKNIPKPCIEFSFKGWPPSNEDINEIVLEFNNHEIELLIVNDWAFHNLMKFKISNRLKKASKFQTALLTQTQTNNYDFGIPFNQVMERTNEYNHFITVSKNVLNEWKAAGLSTENSNCHCIPNCCNESNLDELNVQDKQEVRQRLKLPKHCFISVCVATIQHRKNQQLIINNAHSLFQNYPNDLFLFVGGITNLGGAEIAEQIYNSKFNENMKLIGEVDDARPYIRAADILVLPSLGEVMPITILEAIALKTPVLASNVGGINEVIEHLKTGLHFNVNNSVEFLKYFMMLRKNKELRESIATKALIKYKDNFSRSMHESEVKKLIQGIVESDYN